MAKEKRASKPKPTPKPLSAEQIIVRKTIVAESMKELQLSMASIAKQFELSAAETSFILSETLAALADEAMTVEHEQYFGEDADDLEADA